MTVNALVTGLIVFKILKVFSKVRPTYDQSLGSTRNAKRQVRQVIFIIIESGMALFAIVPVDSGLVNLYIQEYVVVAHQMLNVIIRSVHI